MTKIDQDNQESFSISELSATFNLTSRALRFYETKKLIEPTRAGSRRIYSKRDKARLALVVQGKNVGFSLDEIKEMLDLYDIRDGQKTQMKITSVKFRAQIAKLIEQKSQIEVAISELSKLCDQVDGVVSGKTSSMSIIEILDGKTVTLNNKIEALNTETQTHNAGIQTQ
ncbi:MAG: MerR family DNA-binding transcriptional regulator [OCS116 cluster bacterium]|nr:MerR family DNA-binding transcriptional regulator [OCS116 cluster bacterium]